MANIALVKEQLITFTSALSLIMEQLKLLKEHAISQEVHISTQRKMFTKQAFVNNSLIKCNMLDFNATLNASIFINIKCLFSLKKEGSRKD